MTPPPGPRGSAEADAARLAGAEGGLAKALTRGQVIMIGLGGAIGTGLFAGSRLAIGYAGPAVVVSYLIAALAAGAVVLSLAEMAAAHPTAGSFGVYAESYLHPFAGFLVRYTYWMAQVAAVGGEAVAAGVYMTFWFPGAPVWIWSLAFAAALIALNARSVKSFARFESAFALVKVAAIIGFIALGLCQIVGLGAPARGFGNLTGLPGGFAPHGAGGVWMAVIMGIFSFNGVELVAVTSGEAKDPGRTVPAALVAMALRLTLFYVLALLVVVTVTPWTALGGKTLSESPFVTVFRSSGVRAAAGMMNFVVLTAALSSMNTNLYLCSRMVFSLARGGYAPGRLGALSPRGVPTLALLLSGAGVLAAAGMSKFTPWAYNILFGVALFGAIAVWIIILLSHFGFRRARRGLPLPHVSPFFPLAQILALGLLVVVLVTMGLDADWRLSWICGVPWFVLLALAYGLRRRFGARPAAGSGAASPLPISRG